MEKKQDLIQVVCLLDKNSTSTSHIKQWSQVKDYMC